MIRGALLCTRKELRIRLRDRWALVMWLLVPLTIGGMITAVGGGGDPTPTARLLVADQDDSLLSQFLIGALDQGQDGQLIQAESVDLEAGRTRIGNGDGSALLIIPEGFGDAVLKETPARLELITNPAQQILPGIIEEFLGVLVDGVFYLHRVFGDELKIIAAQIDDLPEGQTELFSDVLIAELSISFNDAIESVVAYLDPLALELAEGDNEGESPGVNFALVFFPGIVFMGLIFASQGLSGSFWQEREDGTLRRMLVTPLSTMQIFLGKLFSGTVLLLLLSLAMAALGFAYHGLRLLAFLPAVLWLTLSGLMLYGLMTFLQLVAPTKKSAALLTNLLVFPLMMLGGAFFPFEALPEWLVAIGNYVPNGYMLERLKAFLIYDGGADALLSGLPVALIMILALWLLAAWRVRAFAGAAE